MTDASVHQCSRKTCHVPTSTCDAGEMDYRSCQFWRGTSESSDAASVTSVSANIDSIEGTSFPWTGNTLGLDDLQWVAARSRPRIIGLVGTHNAGKTTFLISMYLGWNRGHLPLGAQFAGSFTVGGWENLAHYLRYPPHGIGPGFPPHTPASSKAAPGLLHLATRDSEGTLKDVIFTDAPGESFAHWAINVGDQRAAEARWCVRHSDVFLLFVDREAMAGSNRGAACVEFHNLSRRLSRVIGDRPIGIVWAKSDIELRPDFECRVRDPLAEWFPSAEHFSVTIKAGDPAGNPAQGFQQVLSWALRDRIVAVRTDVPIFSPANPFLSYRGHR